VIVAKQALQRTKGKLKDNYQHQSLPQDQIISWHRDKSPQKTRQTKNRNTENKQYKENKSSKKAH
jgi:hypothetical protein